jgi:hypothetical protein
LDFRFGKFNFEDLRDDAPSIPDDPPKISNSPPARGDGKISPPGLQATSSLPSSTPILAAVPPPIPSLPPPPPPPPPPGQAPRLSTMNSNVHYRQPFTTPLGPIKGLHWHRIVYPAGATDFEKSIWSELPKTRVDYQMIQKAFGKKHTTAETGKISTNPFPPPLLYEFMSI